MARALQYGAWPSPLGAAEVARAAKQLAQPRWFRGALHWLESRPDEGGRQCVMRRDARGTREVTPARADVRSRVHEYGGGEFGFAGDALVYCDAARPGIWRASGEPVRGALTNARYADFVASPDGRWLVAVEEEHARALDAARAAESGDAKATARASKNDHARARELASNHAKANTHTHASDTAHAQPANRLVAFDLQTGARRVLAGAHDFVSSPCFAPDGKRLVFLAWDHPRMPWDGCELFALAWGADGPLERARRIAGGARESIFQPGFASDGALTFISDASGYGNPWQQRDAQCAPILKEPREFGTAQWTLGMRRWVALPDGALLCAVTQEGSARLLRLDPASGARREYALPFTHFESVASEGARVALLAAGPDAPLELCTFDPETEARETIARAFEWNLHAGDTARPEALRFASHAGRSAHAFLYRPARRAVIGKRGARPPLIVRCHGGPTDAARPVLQPKFQYWTSRGFALLDVNYAGSTGYGRSYREALNGGWGVADVEDCLHAARFAARERIADPTALAINGGSAGGFTALCALARGAEFAVGASHYGIGDLEALLRETHKFEAHYLDTLIGPYPQARARYRERSPLHQAAGLRRPTIFFQGLRDKVVPPAQADALAAALRARGVPHALVRYAEEGHGFRSAKNIQHALESEIYFYGRVLGFAPDARPQPAPKIIGARAGQGAA